MASDVTLDDLMAKQKAMTALAAQLIGEEDTTKIQEVAAQLQGMGEELERMAAKFAEEHSKGPVSRPVVEVVLTAEQRKRILDTTGVELQSITMPDPAGVSSKTMPTTDPRLIEYYAMKEAAKRQVAAAAKADLEVQLAQVLAEIESQGTPELLAQLEQVKSDPKFLGGMLRPK